MATTELVNRYVIMPEKGDLMWHIELLITTKCYSHMIFKNILTHIIANSEETKRSLLQNLSKYVGADKIKVISNGIHIDKRNVESKPLEKIKKKSWGIVLGNAGRLTAQKDRQYLLEVVRILKKRYLNYTLFIADTDKLKKELDNKIKAFRTVPKVLRVLEKHNMKL